MQLIKRTMKFLITTIYWDWEKIGDRDLETYRKNLKRDLISTFVWQPLVGLVMYLYLILFLILGHLTTRLAQTTTSNFFVSLFLSGISKNRFKRMSLLFCDLFRDNGLSTAYFFLTATWPLTKSKKSPYYMPKLQIPDHFRSKSKLRHCVKAMKLGEKDIT